MGQFHGAMFRIALDTGTSIVPVAICGNEDKPKKGSPWLTPGVIRIEKLPAVKTAGMKEISAFKLKNQVRESIARVTQRLEP